jgi:hypothetical protein
MVKWKGAILGGSILGWCHRGEKIKNERELATDPHRHTQTGIEFGIWNAEGGKLEKLGGWEVRKLGSGLKFEVES